MTTPKEFNIERTFTIGFIVYVAIISFALGGVVTKVLSQADDIIASKAYTEQEVSGLRADWERQNKIFEKRLDKLEEKK